MVSYRDGTNGDLDVLVCGNADCTASTMTTPDATGTPASPLGYDTSIAIGADGFPIVSYYDDAANGDLKVLRLRRRRLHLGEHDRHASTRPGTSAATRRSPLGADGCPSSATTTRRNGDLKLARPPCTELWR